MKRTPLPTVQADVLDPTRALDGFSLPSRSDEPLDLSSLFNTLHQAAVPPAKAAMEPERLARLKQRGFEMSDVEDVEIAEIRPARVEPPPAVDLAAIWPASQTAQAASHPRLLKQWQPGAWLGLQRRVIGARTEVQNSRAGPVLESLPPQWLLAAWPPQAMPVPPGRWPEQALLRGAPSPELAAQGLLNSLPEQALLWLGDWDADWALLAELVLHHDPALQPFQMKALRELAEAERLSTFANLNDGYRAAANGRPLSRKT